MKVYLFLDEDGFCEGWGSNEEVNSVPYEIEDDEVLRGIMKYRYVDGQLIYDETKALLSAKDSRKYKARKQFLDLLGKGFEITILGTTYTYPYDEDGKAYLDKVYELCRSGLIDEATFSFKKDDEDVIINVDRINVAEMWLLSYLHEEDLKRKLNDYNTRVENAQTLEELRAIVLE